MKILMTGSSGFVGKHLVPLLERENYELFHLVRINKGYKREFIWGFSGHLHKNFPVCDVVIHLAASVNFSQQPEKTQYLVNTVSTARLAKYCQEKRASFILASTIGVHGNANHISSNTDIIPSSHYGMSKFLAEQMVNIFPVNASILRISGIYGFDGPSHLGLNVAITKAIREKAPPVLKGSGEGKRNYICVSDVANWILNLVQKYENNASLSHKGNIETIYLAGPDIIAIEEYLQIIVEILLPREKLIRENGLESRDCVVDASRPPFQLTAFKDYLNKLKRIHKD